MQGFQDLPFKLKLRLPIAAIAFILLVVGSLGIYVTNALTESSRTIGSSLLPAADVLIQADRDLYQALVAERSMIFVKEDSEDFAALEKDQRDNIDQAYQRVNAFDQLYQTAQTREMVEQFNQLFDVWKATTLRITDQRKNGGRVGRTVAIDLSFGDGASQFDAMRDVIDKLTEIVEAASDTEVVKADATASRGSQLQILSMGIGLLLCLVVGWFYPLLITNPLTVILSRIEDISKGEGDLTARVALKQRDELGALAHALDEFLAKLQGIIKQAQSTSSQVSDSAKALTSTASATLDSVNDQHASIEHVVSAISQMAASVQEVAASADQAAQEVSGVSKDAVKGQEVVGRNIESIEALAGDIDRVANAIKEVERDSDSIGSVLEVITTIAEQTNLLALNAAIEAARAGEYGRGFAVVADEVRNLASRTQQSTEEIRHTIEKLQSGTQSAVALMETSQSRVQGSVDYATSAGQTLSSITASIQAINDMNGHMASAAREQSQVTEEINATMHRISALSNKSADSVAHSNQAAEYLSQLASELQSEVGRFKT